MTLVRLRGTRKAAKVCLIRPPSVVTRFGLTLTATPPLSLALLAAALTEAGHGVQLIDAVGEGLTRMTPGFRDEVLVNGLPIAEVVDRVEPDAQMIGISCMFSHEWPLVRELIAALGARFPGVPIVCGGEHATAAPEHSLSSAPALTACALGEGEETVVDIADAVAAGEGLSAVAGLVVRDGVGGATRTARRERLRDLDAIPLPRWDMTPVRNYLDAGCSFGVDRGRTMPVLATRGCPYRCTFCSSPQMWTTRYAVREPRLVVDEIERYVRDFDVRNIDFYDLTAIIRREWILEFCRLMLERRLPVTWQLPSGTRSEALDDEVCVQLFASGCRNVSYAPESGSPRVLKLIKKKVNLDRMLASMRSATRAGINVKANILIGFPDEGPDDLRETAHFLVKMARAGCHDVSIWTFSPYPGSQLFDELRASGRIDGLTDGYLFDLLSYSNLTGAVSYCDAVPARELERYRVAGLALFYAASYSLHPIRPLRSLANITLGEYESRLEMSLANLVRRLSREAKVRLA